MATALVVALAFQVATNSASAHEPLLPGSLAMTENELRERLQEFPQFDNAVSDARSCLADAGYIFDAQSNTVTLPDGGTLEPPTAGNDSVATILSSGYQDWVRAGDRCNESAGVNDILEAAGIIAPAPAANARVAFFNEIERAQHGCLVDRGWELGEMVVNRFGQVEYEWRPRQDHDRWSEWVDDVYGCRVELFGWRTPPEEIIPPVESE